MPESDTLQSDINQSTMTQNNLSPKATLPGRNEPSTTPKTKRLKKANNLRVLLARTNEEVIFINILILK